MQYFRLVRQFIAWKGVPYISLLKYILNLPSWNSSGDIKITKYGLVAYTYVPRLNVTLFCFNIFI